MKINTSGLGRPSALAEKRYSASRLSNIQVKKAKVHRGNSLVPCFLAFRYSKSGLMEQHVYMH